MEIHLVSSLTPDDECRLAPQVLSAIERILDPLPITYCVRVETAAGNEIQHSHTAPAQRARLLASTESIDALAGAPSA
ncbi:MAG: hypothetical protein KBA95_02265 [Acidobacteria bacterium]|nr:hypothetical protein [Acidobacteriota bacterium]